MSKLWDLERLNTGERTALKRAAGSLAFNVAARRAFYKADVSREESWEDMRYAAMCMACLWSQQDQTPVLKMEECLKRMCWEKRALNDAMAHRVDNLLETAWGDDDYLIGKVMNVVRMMRAGGGFRPDFEALAWDFRRWNHDSRTVQRKWLKAIYNDGDNDRDNKEADSHDA